MKKHLPLIGIIVLALAAIALATFWSLDRFDVKHQWTLRYKWTTAARNYTNEWNWRVKLEGVTNEMQGVINTKQKQIEKLTDDNKKLDEALTATKAELETAKSTVEKLNALVKENEEKVKTFDEMKKTLDSKIAGLTTELETAAKANTALTGETNRLNLSVIDWTAKHDAQKARADKYEKRLLDNKIPLEPDKLFLGHVLVVNKEQEFLILDIGSDDMLPVGKELNLIRDNRIVGTVVIKKLLTDNYKLSLATVESLVDPNNPAKEGDQVKNVQQF